MRFRPQSPVTPLGRVAGVATFVLSLSLLAAATSPVAHAGEGLEPAFEAGVHAGVFVFDGLDVPNTSYQVVPRLGLWFNPTLGLEVDVGLSTGTSDGVGATFTALTPQLTLIGDPVPHDDAKAVPIRPIVTVSVGAMHKMIDGPGAVGKNAPHSRTEALVSVGTGLVVPIVGPLSFRTDVRAMTTAAAEDERYGSPFINFAWTGGFQAVVGLAKDTDKDKIPDKNDLCPADPEDVDAFEDADGCPEADNDKDGVLDASDGAPTDAEDIDGFQDTDGVPDPDNDGDTVLDTDDLCPLEAGSNVTAGCPDVDVDGIADKDDACPTLPGIAAFRGCPDTDGDGLTDPKDECPTEAGAADAFGCPDGDGDLVPDRRDKCLDKPANKGADPRRSDGCPARVFVSRGKIEITEVVYFDSGKASIQAKSNSLLDEVADIMLKHPGIEKVEVEGHTDDQGDDAKNLKLSDDRAKAVMAYLVGKGVDAARLSAKGFGETQPIADNKTPDGRAQNRRVVFQILAQKDEVEVKTQPTLKTGSDLIQKAEDAK
jgi:outer membrane protein OmpA-like peptidoglycan-associated protein